MEASIFNNDRSYEVLIPVLILLSRKAGKEDGDSDTKPREVFTRDTGGLRSYLGKV